MKQATPNQVFLIMLGLAMALYLIVSVTAYRFRHPWKSETELFLEIPRALVWAQEER